MARAIDTFCRMPVDILAPSTSRMSFIASRVKRASIRSASGFLLDAVQAAEVFDHFPGGHAVVDAGVGRHETDAVPHLRRLGDAIEAGHRGPAGRRPQHRAQDAQHGRLAGAVGAEQAVDLAGRGVEADSAQGDEFAVLDCRHNVSSIRGRGSYAGAAGEVGERLVRRSSSDCGGCGSKHRRTGRREPGHATCNSTIRMRWGPVCHERVY